MTLPILPPASSDETMVDRLIDAAVYRERAHMHQRKSAQSDLEEARHALLSELAEQRRLKEEYIDLLESLEGKDE